MVLISILLAPVVMAGAALAERRLGPSAAGWVGALPVAMAVAVLVVATDSGPDAAAAMALSAAVHVPAQVALGVVFAHVLHRHGLLRGAAGGALAYVAVALLVERLPAAVAVLAAVIVLWAAPRVMPTALLRTPSARSRSSIVLTCAGAALIVAAAVLCSRWAGPAPAGAVAAFPTMCTMLTVVAVTCDGRAAGVHTLIGLVRSLPCYLAFGLTFGLTAPLAGPAAVAYGLMACLAVAAVLPSPLRRDGRPVQQPGRVEQQQRQDDLDAQSGADAERLPQREVAEVRDVEDKMRTGVDQVAGQ
ncbi:hypothetical protein KOI35_22275 [Actinoplanes bogorensis]|uniref:Uncharacterized protein n=1 Tax=Paractinoplanes bogorensis TaxID=1610840 RepID=A0ABS5YS05_9ACTN|nr:hypothetical protein [Actinoplanes bogorensis]MBU2666232.1 hypothetical protein [Actinoplanes bogorensis]